VKEPAPPNAAGWVSKPHTAQFEYNAKEYAEDDRKAETAPPAGLDFRRGEFEI